MKDYIEKDDGDYRIAGTRVSLDSVVYAFREGQSPESIVQSFPALRLEQVYGAITFYLAHRSEIDAYLDQARQDYEAARQAERAADPEFYERLAEARRQQVAPR
jgi:uncharacterized protein (DUF433 family)